MGSESATPVLTTLTAPPVTRHRRMSLKEKISAFNKPEGNEDELREQQRKKASYNSKIAKFESTEIKSKKTSDAKLKAKMFEDMEGQKEREKEAELRKEDFKKKKEAF